MDTITAFLADPVVTRSLGAMLSVLLLIGCRRAFKFDHLCALNFDQG